MAVAKKKKAPRPADTWVPSPGTSYWRNVEPLGSRQAAGPKDELHMLATALLVTALAGLCAFVISSTVAATITTLGAAAADILATLVAATGAALGAVFGLLGDAFAMVWAILGLPWTALFRALGYASSAHRRFATASGAPPRAYQYPPTTGFLPNSAAATVLPPTSMAPYFPPGAAERYPVGPGGGQMYGEGHMQLRRAELFHKGRCGSSRPDVELCDALKQRRWAGAKDAFDRPPRYGVPVGGVPPGAPGGGAGCGGAASYAAAGGQSWCAAPGPAQCGAPQPVCSPPPQQVPVQSPSPVASSPAPSPASPVAAEVDEFTQCVAQVEQEFAPKLEAARKESERAQRQAAKPSLLRRFTNRLTGKQQAHPGGLAASPGSLVVPGTLSVGADGAACRAARMRNNATLLALRAAQAELQSAVAAATDAHAACHSMLEKDVKAAGGADHVACVQKGDALSQVAENASTAVEALAKEAAIKMQTIVMMCGGSASK